MAFSLHPLPEQLTASGLANDPRLQEGKKLLLSAVAEHQANIKGVRPPLDGLKVSYQEMLDAYATLRGGKLWYPYISSGLGNGALVELCDGSVKYDFICGIGPHFFGHSHPLMVDASVDAALGDTVMQGHLQQGSEGLALSKILLEGAGMAPGSAREGHCFLTTSGVMAVENGLKIAFQNRYPANRILALNRCFAGRTLAASQVTDKAAYRDGLPDTVHTDYVPFYDPEDPEGSTAKAAAVLNDHLYRNPKKHAVMVFELIQGEGGFRSGTTEYFETLMRICKDHDVLVMVDEVQSFGRTPELFAYQFFGLEDYVDIVTVGKVLQVCGTLYRTELKPRPGLLSQTFTGSTTALRTGYSIVHALLNDNFLGPEGRIAQMHTHFLQNLQNMEQRFPDKIRGPYGIGGMIAFTPYDGTPKAVLDFSHRLFENGLITFTAGVCPVRIRFLPPIGALTLVDIDNAIAIVEKTLTQG